MKLSRLLGLSALAGVLTLGTASAGSINGSIPFAGIGLTINGGDLVSSTVINAAVYETSGLGAGDYSNVPQLSNFTEGGGLDLTNLGAFNFSNAIGTFQANGALSFIVTQQTGCLDVFLRGLFTPGAGAPAPLAGEDPTDTSPLRLTIWARRFPAAALLSLRRSREFQNPPRWLDGPARSGIAGQRPSAK